MNDAERYDALLDAGREPPSPCPVCTGDEDAAPCSEDCERILLEAARKRVAAYTERAERVAEMAIRYAREGGSGDPRIGPCIEEYGRCLDVIERAQAAMKGAA